MHEYSDGGGASVDLLTYLPSENRDDGILPTQPSQSDRKDLLDVKRGDSLTHIFCLN